MGKISEIFNFENIGGKIKNLAKWSCWITILLIWIAAPIAFFILIAEESEFVVIPLVAAIIAPVLVWIGSWAMYAFGEFVERTCDNEDNTRLILEKLTEDNYDSDYTPTDEADEDDFVEDDFVEDDEPQEDIPTYTKEDRKRKIARITELRKKGLITEEMYQQAINNPKVLERF
ncbi:MAG: hypothetical protein J6Q92_05690 [Oscillospiraceae bacterium]|nr:hypothetical protein [Oscillospiraceae bacterium]